MSAAPLELAMAALLGLVIGSFLNVVIHRLPRETSVVGGRSRCPKCNETISWYDNVPVFSYVVLGGRCRRCRDRISLQYPLVELISAGIAFLTVYSFGVGLKAIWIYAFLVTLLAITIIDWHHRIIPDELSIGGIVFGWVGALVCLDVSLVDSFIGSLVGGGLLLAIAVFYKVIRKVDGMGGGDVKLMAMIGAFLGWKMIFPVLFLASLFGSIYGLYLMARGGGGKTAVAFGSFLAPAATMVLFFGRRLWGFYTSL